jgi:hypothetical protein
MFLLIATVAAFGGDYFAISARGLLEQSTGNA